MSGTESSWWYIVVVCRTRVLAVTGSKHGKSFFIKPLTFSIYFLLSELILVWIRVRVRIRVSISCISAIKTLFSSWKRQDCYCSKWQRPLTKEKLHRHRSWNASARSELCPWRLFATQRALVSVLLLFHPSFYFPFFCFNNLLSFDWLKLGYLKKGFAL